MGRWTQYDEDSSRLPEGMTRIGYDADTQQYTFQDADGSIWESAPGCEYGRLTKVSTPNTDSVFSDERNEHEDAQQGGRLWSLDSAADRQQMIKNDMKYSWRMLGPFLLLVCLVPILLFRMTSSSSGSGQDLVKARDCAANGANPVIIRQGDTCWDLAQKHSITLDELKELNSRLNCEALRIGQTICIKEQEKIDHRKT